MSDWTIYFNSKCSKCRGTMAILEEKGIRPQIIEYLTTPPTEQTLTDIVKKLGKPARELVRVKDDAFSKVEVNLDDDQAVIQMLSKHPELIERPIVIHKEKALVARPPEKVLELFC